MAKKQVNDLWDRFENSPSMQRNLTTFQKRDRKQIFLRKDNIILPVDNWNLRKIQEQWDRSNQTILKGGSSMRVSQKLSKVSLKDTSVGYTYILN